MISRNINLPENFSFFLFGPRQTGKTTLINFLYTDHDFRINLLMNQQVLKYSKNPDILIKEVEEKVKNQTIRYLVVDEIQKVPALLNAIQYIIDNYRITCVITGSSARNLKRGMANLLGGRAVQRFLFPFIWNEISDRYSIEEYLSYGSLPPVVLAEKEMRSDILNSYVETYIREEIQAEGIIRNIGSFSRFLDMAAAQFGEQVNYSEVARECQLPTMTVKSYYEILEDTLIGVTLFPWRKSIRKRLSAHPKVYLFDNGVTNAINRYMDEVFDPVLLGRLFEQFLVCETFRILKYRRSNAQMFYWRTNTGSEVDLLIEKNKIILAAFEIKYSRTITSTHLSGLRSFLKDNPNVPCFIVCRVDEGYSINDIQIINWQRYFGILENYI